MASNFRIQKPYVLTALPRPIESSCDNYVVGDVYGQQQGSKRKRRSELAVGINGEATNIYDVQSSRLITSYPIPPQSTFTCPPYSIRWRSSTSKYVSRYTYISTRDPGHRISLFKDSIETSGKTVSTTFSRTLPKSQDIVLLSTTSHTTSDSALQNSVVPFHLIAVTTAGSVLCLDAETLEEIWAPAAKSVFQDSMPSEGSLRVDFAQLFASTDAAQGLFGGWTEVLGPALDKSEPDLSSLDVLVLITAATVTDVERRHLRVLAVSPNARGPPPFQQQHLAQAHIAPLVQADGPAGLAPKSIYRVDIASSSLLELRGEELISYDIARAVPRVERRLSLPGAQSFIRLSKSSILAASDRSFDVLNPVFQSVQASTPLDMFNTPQTSESSHRHTCHLVTYFPKLEMAVAIIGTSLVAVQLEAPMHRSKKRRAEGLLIDSIGRGTPRKPPGKGHLGPETKHTAFSRYLPGSVSAEYWSQLNLDVQRADELLVSGNLRDFECLLARKFDIKVSKSSPSTGGLEEKEGAPATNGTSEHDSELPDWQWPKSRSAYPEADRRWVMYAIGRAFSWTDEVEGTVGGLHLRCQLPEGNVVNYLADAGHLSTANLRSAFRVELRGVDDVDAVLGEELPLLLADIDPTMGLLLTWLHATTLGSSELLTAIKLIMRSLELVQDPTKMGSKPLITNSTSDPKESDAARDGAGNKEELGMELDRLEQEIQVTEYYLDDESSTRARGLSVAFGKLGSCPAQSTIATLRRNFRPEEILSLIYVLRMELVKDGWTTRYLDLSQRDEDDESEAPPDGSIRLLADLLCRCIDSVGAGGWLINDAILAAGNGGQLDSADFLASLKLEVSAALEGVQEAVYLRGILNEAVRYGSSVQSASATRPQADSLKHATTAVRSREPGWQMLPLGLKASQNVSRNKVVSGGELVRRSKREFGHLTSQKVGAYSLERIVI
ncbi:uncharacterized protein E0L32_006456 [Thyridium curvatum]|uniref:Utp8 beta-propeller domain-containing protein n=1 Tax=Thyridium curvatum TaxID=1093900 RepID=A0A507B8Q6_9PEZI|nr:uncharacterized protein E0L32_006456 [Thyridium curvatum]TPX13030.1 hypothetical protein E0L32_006456 [Thyridium curvatum]